MELKLLVVPGNLFPSEQAVLNLQVVHTDTIEGIKDRLARKLNKSEVTKLHFVWAGSVVSDTDTLYDAGLRSPSTACLVPPSSLVKGASAESLKIFQELQYHYLPQSQQKHESTLVDLIDLFTQDLLTSEAPWKPATREIDLLHWALKVLRNASPPSKEHPSVKWFGEYGCALVSRRTAFEEISFTLVCLDNWCFRIHSASSSRVYSSVPDDNQFTALFVGCIPFDKYNSSIEAFHKKLAQVQQRKKDERTSATGNQGHHKTPCMIQAVMLDVLNNSEDHEVIPKGGFTDVGLHTGGHARNTSWPLVVGVISHLLDSKDADMLFRQLMLQLPLRMAENSVAYFLGQIKDSSSDLGRNPDCCRRLTDCIMQTLCLVAEKGKEFARMNSWDAEFGMLEARCVLVRYELDCACEIRGKRIADQYLVPSLPPSNVRYRDFNISVPPKWEAQNFEFAKDIFKIACENLSLLPAPLSSNSDWEEMEGWMEKHCCSYEDDYVRQQVICKAVEKFFFEKIMNLADVQPLQVQGIMDQYREVARKLQRSSESHAVLRVELFSKELLVIWIAFCLVHHTAKKGHPLLSNYSVPLRADDLRYLVLTDIDAVNAARIITKYLRENQREEDFIFSGHPSDKTLEFALKQGRETGRILTMLNCENQKMKELQESRWEEIRQKQQRLEILDKELEVLLERQSEVCEEIETLSQEWKKDKDESFYYVPKPQVLSDTERHLKNLKRQISAKNYEISTEEKTPPPILQPLPSDPDLATKVLYFLNMPSDLKILSAMSFTAQQTLLPCLRTITVNPSPGVMKEIDIDKEISSMQPQTLWYEYYTSMSSAREYGRVVSRNGLTLGSSNAVPSGRWYSSSVRNISSSTNGVWYPDSLEPRLFWNGGGCSLDVRDGRYFNPFKTVSSFIQLHKFTEALPVTLNVSTNSAQWSLYQGGENEDTKRENFALASQDTMVNWLPCKNAFLDFCGMRAYPLQQIRRLCATLWNKCLPLMSPEVRVLMQQTVHQLGNISNKESSEREWYSDLNNFNGWESLRMILNEICDELRSKSREHTSILTVGELAAQASQWDPECRVIARKFASIAESAADDLSEHEMNAMATDVPTFRARRCILYMSCVICHSAGSLSSHDVAQLVRAQVMADYTRLFEDPSPYETEVSNLTAISMSVMAKRMSAVLKEVRERPQILTVAVSKVHEAASREISWKVVVLGNESTTCLSGTGTNDDQYSIDLHIGTVLVDGRPPSRLPKAMLSSPLYRRSFSDRNFEVVRKNYGILSTTREIDGRFYEFSQNQQRLLIREVDSSDPNSSLELLDGTDVDSWGKDLPKRLKMMHSHWLCRKTNTIVLRPKSFRQRKVNYVLTVQGHSTLGTTDPLQDRIVSESRLDWMCFSIPIHLQNKDWLAQNRDLSKLNRLVYLTDDTSRLILRIFEKFERTKGCIETLRTVQNTFLIVLPRFGLEFELTADGRLKSNTLSSYELCTKQNFDDTLIDFSEYLILESHGTKKVLVPVGQVCNNATMISISGVNNINAIRRFHIYSIHPRFETLESVPGKVSIEARLQLGALYAATGTMLPEKKTGKTGGEHAIELLRQSWKNSPMSREETIHLKSISSFGKLYPTLSLLAYELYSSSQLLYFLPFEDELQKESISMEIDASTEYVLRKKRQQLNPRALLTPDEEKFVLSCEMARSARRRQVSKENVMRKKRLRMDSRAALPTDRERIIPSWDTAGPVREGQKEARGIGIDVLLAGPIMTNIRNILKGMLRCPKDVKSGTEFPFGTSAFGDTLIGKKIGNDLRESWKDYVELPTCQLSFTNYAEVQARLRESLVRCSDCRHSIEKEIHLSLRRISNNRVEVSCFNMRRAANLEPQGTRRDFLKIACDIVDTDLFNPFLKPESSEGLRCMILEWMQLCVMEDKLLRMLKEAKLRNAIELVRELQEVDRRWDISQHTAWLAFEVEEQLQIRDLQYKVADFFLQNPGKITQLNMGEGKTRVILPMLVLEIAKRGHLMRIHFLSPLLTEAYDFLHHTVTASVLNRRFVRLPFHRDVKLTYLQAVKILQSLRRCQDNDTAICIAPEHRLSLLLKKSELEIQESKGTAATRQVLQQIYDLPYFDLFDESDELLHHRYQLIYAVGSCIPLSSGKQRWTASQAVLNQLQHNEQVAEVLEVVATRDKFNERLPGSMDSIRLLPDCTEEQQKQLLRNLAVAVTGDPPYSMRWLKRSSNLEAMISFMTEEDKSLEWLCEQIADRTLSQVQKECLLALRGILAYGLLDHCISHRYRVDYGIDQRRQTRRVAVPYRGSDMPSDRAEYAHPDILILFTHLAYYYRGLSKQEVIEAVQALLKLGPIAQREEYKQWLYGVSSLNEKKRQIDDVDKLDISSDAQMKLMQEVYQFNMATIAFWLDACVLPKETMQFPARLTANAFHLADNKNGNIIGFSGTKDNSMLLPVQVVQDLPDILEVKATDGKMLHLILKNQTVHCLPSSVSLFEAILVLCVEQKVSALIDAGALMAGLENEDVAQRMISLTEGLDGNDHQGVVYYEKKEASWMVLSTDGRQWPLGSSPIHERDAFVYFDESRCRGADMKLQDTASALLTIGPYMCKDKIMQAAGRMRKLDRGQSLMFAVPPEIALKIPVANGSSLTSKEVLQWVVGNTATATAKGLLSWSSQGSLYCTTKDLDTRLTNEVLELEELYQSSVEVQPISEIVRLVQSAHRARLDTAGKRFNDTDEAMMKKIMERALKYGSDQKLILSQADEECEREIEHERELEREREVIIAKKTPCSQRKWDFDALLRVTSANDVLRLTDAMSISEAMRTRFASLRVDGIAWDRCMVYLTRNFMNTVAEEDGRAVQNYSNYLRPVDTVIFFNEGTCCLLVSEWEAGKLLGRVWKYCEENDENEMVVTYANFAFLFGRERSQVGNKCHFSIPGSNADGSNVVGRASEYTLAGLQLFGGLTMFHGEGRKGAMRDMLASDKGKRSALRLVTLRGSGRMIARSDLEDICSENE